MHRTLFQAYEPLLTSFWQNVYLHDNCNPLRWLSPFMQHHAYELDEVRDRTGFGHALCEPQDVTPWSKDDSRSVSPAS